MPNIEDHIQKAIQSGQFDDLPGKGQPLRLDDDTFVDPEWRLAHHLLKSGGFTLPWIEKRQQILAQLESARTNLAQTWRWREEALRAGQPFDPLQGEWLRACTAFEEKIAVLNKAIHDYNLEAPAGQFQLPVLNAEREIETTRSGS